MLAGSLGACVTYVGWFRPEAMRSRRYACAWAWEAASSAMPNDNAIQRKSNEGSVCRLLMSPPDSQSKTLSIVFHVESQHGKRVCRKRVAELRLCHVKSFCRGCNFARFVDRVF